MKNVMKKIAMVLTVAMALGTLVGCGSKASSGSTIKFATNPEFPPFEYVTSNGVIGEFDGIDMAIAKKIAEDNAMEVAMESMEFDSLLVALQNGQIDAVIAGMTVTEERAQAVDFSTPYYVATQDMIGEYEKEQIVEDLKIQKAVDFVVSNAKEK